MTRRRRCWSGVRCSRADSTSKAPARWLDPMTPTSTPSWICSTPWCANRCSWPTGHRGGPGFRCWRRSASSPRSNSSPGGRGDPRRACPLLRRAGTDILALWDSPRQREAYTWFTTELANLRTAFRWAADHGDLDVPPPSPTYAGFLGGWSKNTSRSHGPKSSSNPGTPSTTRGSRALCDCVAVLLGRTVRGWALADEAEAVLGTRDGGYRSPGILALGWPHLVNGQPDRGAVRVPRPACTRSRRRQYSHGQSSGYVARRSRVAARRR